MNLQKGDIIFSKPKKSSFVRYLSVELPQNEAYGHSSIYIGNDTIVEAQFSGGVSRKKFSDWAERNDYRVFRVKNATQKQKNSASEIADKMVGKSYDYINSLKSVLQSGHNLDNSELKKINKSLQDSSSLFCSTVIVGAYPDVIFDGNKHPENILPIDIMKSPHIYEVKNSER